MFDHMFRKAAEHRRKASRERREAESALLRDYNLKTGQWTGDDSPGDANGYGHTSGNEDGSTDSDENDCEIWFDITQGGDGDDGDGLTYYQETEVYYDDFSTDPTSFTVDDVDGDELDGNQELTHGTRPFMADSDGDDMPDNYEVIV